MGDRDFERLFAEHAEPLFGFLYYRTADRDLTQDILADTFERALRGRRGFDRRRGSEKNWLYTIALNCLRDHARRTGAEERSLARVEAGTEHLTSPMDLVEVRDQAERLVEHLPPDEREAVALRYGADLTMPEIARLLKVPLTTVEGRLHRALRRMREAGA